MFAIVLLLCRSRQCFDSRASGTLDCGTRILGGQEFSVQKSTRWRIDGSCRYTKTCMVLISVEFQYWGCLFGYSLLSIKAVMYWTLNNDFLSNYPRFVLCGAAFVRERSCKTHKTLVSMFDRCLLSGLQLYPFSSRDCPIQCPLLQIQTIDF